MQSFEDRIAELVLAQFESLPAKSKPTDGGGGNREWVPLSGVVLIRGISNTGLLSQEFIDI